MLTDPDAVADLADVRQMLDVELAARRTAFQATRKVLVDCQITKATLGAMLEELRGFAPPVDGTFMSSWACWLGDDTNGASHMRHALLQVTCNFEAGECLAYIRDLGNALQRREYATALAVCHLLDLPFSADSTKKMQWLTKRACQVFQKDAHLEMRWVSPR